MSAAAAEELGRLLAEATPGPWRHYKANQLRAGFSKFQIDEVQAAGKAVIAWGGFDAAGTSKSKRRANARLIVAAVNALPGLLAERAALVEALTPSGETKAHYSGEFFFEVDHYDEESQEVLSRRVTVPWTTVKEIMSAIRARALVGGQADG